MGVPLLNEYKRSFLLKRIPQTLLGGLKLRLGYDVPAYVYVNQITLWIVPFLLGCIFTLVLELLYTDEQISNFLMLYSCLYGACIIIFVVIVQTITTVVEMKEKENLHAGIIRKKNSLAEVDDVEFDSCCGADTFAFVIPAKRFKGNIVLHALVSGAVCGLGFWYLLPYSLNNIFSHNYGATATIFILGWFTICTAQYSLTAVAPPEPAIYRTMDTYELQPLTRPLYTLICYSIHIANWYSVDFHVANQALHVVFVVLPLLWFLGLLPPWEILLLWMVEQCHVFLLGGSPAASISRLLVNVVLSAGVFFGCYFLSSCFSSVVLAAGAGYLLSCDLGALGSQIWAACHKNKNPRISSTQLKILNSASAPPPSIHGFMWSWGWSTVYYHGVMTAIAAVAAAIANYHNRSIAPRVVDYLGYSVLGLCVLEKLLRDLQSVFVFFGLWRNVLYPNNTGNLADFKQGKRRLFFLGVLRRTIINWVSPLLMVVYLSLRIVTRDVMSVSCIDSMSIIKSVFVVFGIVRAYRWTWQNTTHALLETAVVHIILVTLSEDSAVVDFGTPILQLFAGITRDRFYQLVNKVYYITALIVTSWTHKKQRHGAMGGIILLNVVFFPVVVVIIVAATAISAPILCLFTLPFFSVGFPRPCKFWPEPVGTSANTCPDSLYYRQLSVELARALRVAFANGSLGEPQAGNHYLMRFQDRLVWVMILERGAGFCTVSIKGLELQETSCHTTEAARFDEQFGEAFDGKYGTKGACSFNSFPLHCLTPVDAMVMKTYSDARNVLTGVIDSVDSVGVTFSFFVKSLIWILLHHVNKLKKHEVKAKRMKEKEIALLEKASYVDSIHDKHQKGGGARRKVKSSLVRSSATPGMTVQSYRKYDNSTFVPIRKHDVIIQHVSGRDSCVVPSFSVNITNLAQDSRPGSRDGSPSQKVASTSSKVHSTSPKVQSTSQKVSSTSPKVLSTSQTVQSTSQKVLSTSPKVPSTSQKVPSTSPKVQSTSPKVQSISPKVPSTSQIVQSTSQKVPSATQQVPSSTFRVSSSPSIPSLSDSLWSEELDLVKSKRSSLEQHHNVSTTVSISGHAPDRPLSEQSILSNVLPISCDTVPPQTFPGSENWKGIDDFLNNVEFGLPVTDAGTPCTRLEISFDEFSSPSGCSAGGSSPSVARPTSRVLVTSSNHIYRPVMNLAGSPDLKCPYSSHISVPVKWRELPIEPSQLSTYMSKFPVSWYKHTLHSLDWSATGQPRDEIASEVATDEALTNCYSQLVMACCSAFDTPGQPKGAHYLYSCYNGDIPWNAMMDWLSEDKDLYKLVMKAFRYGFKLMLDQTLLGGLSDDEDLEEALLTYDEDWYIGKETDTDWGLAVMDNRSSLFSMGQNLSQGTYTSHSLTLQDVLVHMGRVNSESVIGQWSSLNLELLYMTNDDEERYSIQAHPAMLRNLTVQAADPPLGYPIYSSPPISVPTL